MTDDDDAQWKSMSLEERLAHLQTVGMAEMIKAEATAELEGGKAVDYFMPTATDDPRVQAILDRIPSGWGKWISVGNGWLPIVIALDEAIAAKYPDYELNQVKEKFGGLRYYCSCSGDPEVQALIRVAEATAARTCEECGQPGVLMTHRGWLKTVCPAHATEGYEPVDNEDDED